MKLKIAATLLLAGSYVMALGLNCIPNAFGSSLQNLLTGLTGTGG